MSTARGTTLRIAPRAFVARVALIVVTIAAIALLWRSPLRPDASVRFKLATPIRSFALLLVATYVGAWLILLAWTRGSVTSTLKRALLCTSSAVLFLGLLEIPALLGWIDYRFVLPTPVSTNTPGVKPWRNPRNQSDPELLWTRRPGLHLVGTAPGDCVGWLGIATERRYPYELVHDELGFRNPRTHERASIALIGDSFVEGALVGADDLASARLTRDLETEVVNLGMSGYGPQQELVVLRRHALRLSPELVFWFFFEGNDLTDVARYPGMREEWGATVERMQGFGELSFSANLLRVLARACAPRIASDLPTAIRRSATLRLPGPHKGETIYFPYLPGPLMDECRESLKVVEQILKEARAACVERATRLVCVFVPDRARVYRGLIDAAPTAEALTAAPNELPRLLADFCRRSTIEWIDLTPPLHERACTGELLYFHDDGHWNAQGHAAVADHLAAYVRATRGPDATR